MYWNTRLRGSYKRIHTHYDLDALIVFITLFFKVFQKILAKNGQSKKVYLSDKV